jgi:hypothetical protein
MASWPLALVAAVLVVVASHACVTSRLRGDSVLRWELWQRVLLRGLQAIVVVTFCLVRQFSNSILSVWQCESFRYNDVEGTSRSYLVADPRIDCGSDEYSRLKDLGWALLVLWPVLVPIAYAALLWICRKAILTRRLTDVSLSIEFLWRDYHSRFFWCTQEPRVTTRRVARELVRNEPHCERARCEEKPRVFAGGKFSRCSAR